MSDPTRDEMLATLQCFPLIGECDEFDRECAIYWYAANYHGGQWSQLYAALSVSPYHPGPYVYGADQQGEMAKLLYDELVSVYG